MDKETIKNKIYICKKDLECKRWTKVKDLLVKNTGLICPRCRQIAYLPNTDEYKVMKYDQTPN